MSSLEQHKSLVDNLLRQYKNDSGDQQSKLIETHISSVLLLGKFAYKIKKPVDFGFLNFTNLEDRKFYCDEEIRLNSRLAPDIYLETVPITGDLAHPAFEGQGVAIEYAVKMRRFNPSCTLDKLLSAGQLEATIIDDIADQLAQFHQVIPVASREHMYATADKVFAPMQHNFEQIAPLLATDKDRQTLSHLQQWTQNQFKRLKAELDYRQQNGFIRECHGDLHLANILMDNDKAVIFDGIEFSKDLHWIDVANELAFIIMDLSARGSDQMAYRLLNRYLENSGDYRALQLLRFYQVYRAMVRAKVAMLSLQQQGMSEQHRIDFECSYQAYTQLALKYTHPGKAAILLMYGLSGSGKSTVSMEILQRMGAIRIRSDRERKRLFGENRPGETTINAGIYDASVTTKTYRHLLELSTDIVLAGYPVIVDATFLKRQQRRPFQQLAQQHKIPFAVIRLQAPENILEQRVYARKLNSENISDATTKVITTQRLQAEPPSEEEPHVTVRTDRQIDYQTLVEKLIHSTINRAIPGE